MKDKYQIIERISEGNFGQVYKVKDIKNSNIYAMKKIISSNKTKDNFIREIEILGIINHENVVRIQDYEVRDNHITIIMEYCDTNLYSYLKDAIYPLVKQNVKTIAHMILSGLKELHDKSIIHRVALT